MTLIDFLFPKLPTPKTSLNKCLKVPLQRTHREGIWKTGQNTVEICTRAPLSYLLITYKAIELAKVSLIDMPNLGTISEHIGYQ